jgi:cytochrome c oxidase assembly protein subunit 15
MGLAAFIAVVFQGILGGLRVTQLKDEIGIFHATLAQCFFALLIAIALFSSKWWNVWRTRIAAEWRQEPPAILRNVLLATTTLILVQLVLGAAMRHQHAGLAIPDFPLAYGRLWPATDPASVERYNQQRLEVTSQKPITAAHIHLQMTHRLTALAILGGTTFCAWLACRRPSAGNILSRWSLAWLGVISAQAILGMATIWSRKAADIATAHVIFGALALAMGTFLCIVSVQVTAAFHNSNRRPASADQLLPSSARS